ncbi:hypothetical protein H0I76_12190 [Limibaculum sp. M0105]|uniref:Secreted protein n=1 Tax=Thermohalobaculum xanthum TaxID=2753746 RepID=A0A8J7M8M4_9RHOB|nr:hypothetical protein [Thermohalobaculum xanthum]MBK0399952.1 hypothetical protein [Thermohalobaculum xanthum]
MGWHNRIVRAVLAMSVTLGAGGAASAAGEGVDIAGLRLGMSIDEIGAALAEHDPELVIHPPSQMALKYRVVNHTRSTEAFPRMVFAARPDMSESFYVYFTAPPDGGKAVLIYCLHKNFNPPIQRETYRQALIGKYGEPDATRSDATGGMAARAVDFQWLIGEGKVQCLPLSHGGHAVEGPFASVGQGTVESSLLPRIMDVAAGTMKVGGAASPADCAAVLSYGLQQDPVFAATGVLVDVAAAAKDEMDMSAWIEELVRQGEEEVRGSTAAPKL